MKNLFKIKRLFLVSLLFISFFSEGQGILQNLEKLRQEQIITFAYDTDASAFMTATGIPDDATVYYSGTAYERTGHQLWVATDNLVIGFKANGTWTKHNAIYPAIGGTASTHKWNLKDPRDLNAAYRLVFSGTVNHSATGIQGNGSTGYSDTFFNPSVYGLGQNASLSVYSRSAFGTDKAAISAITSTTQRFGLRLSNNPNNSFFYAHGTSGGQSSYAFDNTIGYFVGSRVSSTDQRFYKNGVQGGSTQTSSNGTAPNLNLYLMANNNAGTPANHTSAEIAFVTIGLGLTPTEVANDYTVIQAYQTALGRQLNLWWIIILIPTLLKGRVIKLNKDNNFKLAA